MKITTLLVQFAFIQHQAKHKETTKKPIYCHLEDQISLKTKNPPKTLFKVSLIFHKTQEKGCPLPKGRKYLGPSFGFFVGSPLEGRDLASMNDNQFRVLLL